MKNLLIMILCLCFILTTAFLIKPNQKRELTETIASAHSVKIILFNEAITQEEQFFFQEASLEWQKATNGIVKFIFIYNKAELTSFELDDEDADIEFIVAKPIETDSSFIEIMDIILGGDIIGYYDRRMFPHHIFIVRERLSSEQDYKAVVLHELGHAIGLPHGSEKHSLMYPTSNGSSQCITEIDLNHFCEIYGCSLEQMKPCASENTDRMCVNEDE